MSSETYLDRWLGPTDCGFCNKTRRFLVNPLASIANGARGKSTAGSFLKSPEGSFGILAPPTPASAFILWGYLGETGGFVDNTAWAVTRTDNTARERTVNGPTYTTGFIPGFSNLDWQVPISTSFPYPASTDEQGFIVDLDPLGGGNTFIDPFNTTFKDAFVKQFGTAAAGPWESVFHNLNATQLDALVRIDSTKKKAVLRLHGAGIAYTPPVSGELVTFTADPALTTNPVINATSSESFIDQEPGKNYGVADSDLSVFQINPSAPAQTFIVDCPTCLAVPHVFNEISQWQLQQGTTLASHFRDADFVDYYPIGSDVNMTCDVNPGGGHPTVTIPCFTDQLSLTGEVPPLKYWVSINDAQNGGDTHITIVADGVVPQGEGIILTGII